MDPISTTIGGTWQDKAKEDEINVENIMKASQTHLVVATFLVTVPGDFDSDTDSPNKGMAVLLRKTAFRAFAVSDAISFTCSAGTMFMYFIMAKERRALINFGEMYPLLLEPYNHAATMQLLAMFAVVIAFVSGMYASLAHSAGLADTVYVIGCTSFLVYLWVYCRAVRNELRKEQGKAT